MAQKQHKVTASLEEAMAKIRKEYGDGAVMTEDDSPKNVESIPTGCFALDYILGCGGLPKGRLIEVFGGESSGKSTLALFLSAQIQKRGGTVAYLDNENAYDRAYAGLLGVDTSKLLLSQPATLEETFDIIRAYVESNSVDFIVVDSVASLTPKVELEGEDLLKDSVALQARLLGKGLRILTGPIGRSKTVVLFINQTRSNVGVMFGPKETTPGGKALKFFSSVRLNVKRVSKIEATNKEHVGNTIKVTAVKNKVAPPFREAEFDLYFGEGVDLITDTINFGLSEKVISISGNTYAFGEEKLGVGKQKAKEFLKENPKILKKIQDEINKSLQSKKKVA